MAWDERGSLHCGNEHLYGCEPMNEKGSQSTTDMLACRRGWRIWGQDANCPQCSKPARNVRAAAGSIEQDVLPGFASIPAIPKKSRKRVRDSS